MADTNERQIQERYFAAANGYDGFKNYFQTVFDPQKFNVIYILKGGPGTGKSSLMKKVFHHFDREEFECEAIYCSSDPASFDGVIIRRENNSAAVLDGTSPHAHDPALPGAVETIINLGDNWDEALLRNNIGIIKKLSKLKKHYYDSAYEYLNAAGTANRIAGRESERCYTKSDSDKIREICEGVHGNGDVKLRLVTSYGKGGFGYLDTLERKAKTVYHVVGIYGSEYVFMKNLLKNLKQKKADLIISPSPLSERNTDAIFIENSKIAIIAGENLPSREESVIDTSQYMDQSLLSEAKSKLEFWWKEREVFLWNSANEFKKASDCHFELEKIYSAAMDFSRNDGLYENLIFSIENMLT